MTIQDILSYLHTGNASDSLKVKKASVYAQVVIALLGILKFFGFDFSITEISEVMLSVGSMLSVIATDARLGLKNANK
jgi:hypothetical protein